MAHLVEFLVAGVTGAANGTATFFLRGTGTSAASHLWNEFEMLTQPGTNIITLDANGAAEVYIDVYCDVTLKTNAGSTLRTVTVGSKATCVEVISDSFTGTDYSGSPTGVNEPTTVEAVLDKWNESAGAIDWKVLVGGVSTNLSAAFGQVAGLFLNVKSSTFGAVGDGSTDDTAAIQSAITAAGNGGAIIFFPPGTYKVSTLNINTNNCNFLGSGANSSVIAGNASSAIVQITDHVFTGVKRFENIGFKDLSGGTEAILVQQNQTVRVTNCQFDMTHLTYAVFKDNSSGVSRVSFSGCSFINAGASTASIINNTAPDGQMQGILSNCSFLLSAGFAGVCVKGPGMTVSGCVFDGSAVTSGVYYHLSQFSTSTTGLLNGSAIGCEFLDGGSDGFAMDLRSQTTFTTPSEFQESGNLFFGWKNTYSVTAGTGRGYNDYRQTASTSWLHQGVGLQSRKGREISFTGSGTSFVGNIIYDYETINLNYAANGSVLFTDSVGAGRTIGGISGQIQIVNTSGGSITVNVSTFGNVVALVLASGTRTQFFYAITGRETSFTSATLAYGIALF